VNFYGYWWRYGTFLAVNLVVISIVIQLMTRGAWSVSGFVILALAVADLFVRRILRNRSKGSEQIHSTNTRGGFLRFYGYALAVGGLIWLTLRIRHGITWIDFAPFAIFVLLAVAMLSIGRKVDAPTNPDRQEEERHHGRPL
jgi:hypothetical protein